MSVSDDVANYINAINGSEVVMGRVLVLMPFMQSLLLPEGQEINSAFISEYVDPAGSRTYESAWFFSAAFALEAHNFLSADMFDVIEFKSNIGYIRTDLSAYMPPAEATQRSRMSVNLSFHTPAGAIFGGGTHWGTLKASGVNCRYLYDVTRTVFVPNLVAR